MLKSDDLINKVKLYNKFLNPETLSKAYDFAVKAHENQKRHSGDPYISHPLAVADILLSLKLDTSTIVTGLLHDTLEDTLTTENDLKDEFGEEVVKLVNGVTKLSKIETYTENKFQADNFRKLILAMSKDIRVIVVKLADRLHNMRTLSYLDKDTNIEIHGGVDDIWYDLDKEELVVVDYKAQSSNTKVETQAYLESEYHQGYKIQMDI